MPSPERLAHSRPDRAEHFEGFVRALLDPNQPTPSAVAGPRGKQAARRYNVYRNNVIVSLIDALAAIFPATQRITGADFFRAMARFYVRAHPPTSPLLFDYGRSFPDFIASYEHARELTWLPDVARIERAWLEAYHGADAAPLAPEVLAAIDPERLGETRLKAHPAARIVSSRFPAVTIFALNRTDAAAARIEASEPEDALVTRPGLDVLVRRLPPGGALFLRALIDGCELGAAAVAASEQCPAFDLPANIAGMIEAGVFAEANQGG